MSSSVFKEYPSTSNNNDEADSNLVIVVNKNGGVSVDPTSLHEFLANKDTTNTSVSILRETSPTPSITEEIEADEADEKAKKLKKHDDDEDMEISSNSDESNESVIVPHVSLTVENYYPPSEAKKLAAELLSYAGVNNPLMVHTYEFARYIIQNDHCYTPLTSPSQKVTLKINPSKNLVLFKKKASAAIDNSQPKAVKETISIDSNHSEFDDADDDSSSNPQNLLEDTEETESSEYSFSENDRDSDLDFSIYDRSTARIKKTIRKNRGQKIKNNSLKLENRKKRQSTSSSIDKDLENLFQENSSENLPTELLVKEEQKEKKRLIKSPKKTIIKQIIPTQTTINQQQQQSSVNKIVKNNNRIIIQSNIQIKSPTFKNNQQQIILPTLTKQQQLIQQQQQQNLKKKKPTHVEALFTDMSSLFSSPDIIKKIETTTTPTVTPTTPTAKINQQQHMLITPTTSKGFLVLNPINIKTTKQQQLPSQISIQTLNPTNKISSEQEKQLDLIDSIVKQEMEQKTEMSETQMNEHIPDIVKMLENPNDMDSTILQNVIGHEFNLQATTNSLNSLDLENNQLLDNFTNSADDDLSDDLMQHVAELVENKNLQEIIDKQLSGPLLAENSTPPPLVRTFTPVATPPPVKTQPAKNNPFINPPVQKLVGKEINAPRKHPIQIIRSDGRVITLPPIEAPTTRGAKRRAQNETMSPQPNLVKTPIHIQDKTIEVRKSIDEQKIIKKGSSVKSDGKDSKNSSRRSSTASTVTANTSTMPSNVVNDSDDEMASDDSWNSEDDPDRLWCICQQPHNNRFMICCDSCEEWFHGKCVNITKAMGQQMEENGIEWTCPNCVNRRNPGIIVQDPSAEVATKLANIKKAAAAAAAGTSKSDGLNCLVCHKSARTNSIYCSDDCIRKHAQNSSGSSKTTTTPTATTTFANKSSGDGKLLRCKNDRVVVYERKTGRCLAGIGAPTTSNLKQWLHDHPTFEVVLPNSPQADAIKTKHAQIKQMAKKMAAKKKEEQEAADLLPKKIQTQLKVCPTKQIVLVNPQKPQQQQIKIIKTSQPTKMTAVSSSTPVKITSLPVLKNTIQKDVVVKTPVKEVAKTPIKEIVRPTIVKSSRKQSLTETKVTPSKSEPEPIRVNVKRTLKEQLSLRMSEVTGTNLKLTDEEIENFSHDTENEMFKLFNKDTGTKYKAKYRSLMFNIKDRKNMTLFQKICDKTIKPKQLVKMTPDEMASQELALWRENENKHQLEMIKKSELDLLACAKSYVLKTHKGEEVFESRTSERVLLDPATAIEDVVSVLNNSGGGCGDDEALLTQNPINRFDKFDRSDSFMGSSFTSTPVMVNSSKSSLKKKESRHSRSRSRERHETSRSSRSSKHKRKRSRERRSKSRDTKRKSGSHDKKDDKKDRKKDDEKKKINVKEIQKKPQKIKKEEFNLIDQILEASSSTTDKLKSEEPEIKKEVKIVQPEIVKKSNSFESDQEPTSTVTIPTPPDNLDDSDTNEPEQSLSLLWNGTITYIDDVSLNISIHPVSRDSSNISKHLTDTLKVVGRLPPETVWDYIEKIKVAPNKQVLIVRFSSLDRLNYDSLYNGFYSKNRVGVIESKSPGIKDFYLVPLPAEQQIPHFLMPLTKPGFVEGANKPNLLIGIIVKINGQRSSVPMRPVPKIRRITPPLRTPTTTPPSSPRSISKNLPETRSKLTFGLPSSSSKEPEETSVISSLLINDDDEDQPYSPGGSDTETDIILPSITRPLTTNPPEDLLRKQMEEINRQIEATKMNIAGMTDNIVPYSPTNSVTSTTPPPSTLANIAIPSNLSEILASINKVKQSTAPIYPITNQVEPDEEYTPIAVTTSYSTTHDYIPSKSLNTNNLLFPKYDIDERVLITDTILQQQQLNIKKSPSKLAQLSEAELLSMVPDDIILENVGNKHKSNSLEYDEASTSKKSKWNNFEMESEPLPPGLEEEEYVPI